MKNFLLALTVIMTTQIGIAQETSFDLSRNIEMRKPDSKIKEIKTNVKLGTKSIHIQISSKIVNGTLDIEIYNGGKMKIGEFSIENINNDAKYRDTQEVVSGEIAKLIESPIIGDWTIKLIPKNVIGEVVIQTRLISDL